jgi:hypothetical protein
MTEREQCLGQIDKLIASQVLHGSESLCKLLRYLAEQALDHPGAPLKEYQIATEVFARPLNFDPQHDSVIRVQVGRLRLKLTEYYSREGADDSLVVEIPKGSYAVWFHQRPPAPRQARTASWQAFERKHVSTGRSGRNWPLGLITLSVLLLAAIAIIALLLAGRRTTGQSMESQPAPAAFTAFWKGFVGGPQEPWVIFSNAAFVGRSDTGMRYYDAARDSGELIQDHYTGVGEVLAVHALDHAFGLLHRQIRVKRGSLLALDDVKNNDMIFVGSPAENLTLREIPSTRDFVFRRLGSGPRQGDLAVFNSQPQSGEPEYFAGTPSNIPLKEDYSVIALVRGLNPAKSVLILAGTTTIGTQAAVEYVCQQNSLEELLPRLQVSESGELKPFEAVLRVKVARGVPVESDIVALRGGKP